MDLSTWSFEESLADEECDAAFEQAYEELAKLGQGADGFLKLGSLDCGLSRHFVRQALGSLPEPGDLWPPDEVAGRAAKAQWPSPEQVPPDQMWAYVSAKKFVEVCVSCKLGMAMC